MKLHEGMDGHRFSVAVCHRRFGKTVAALNQLIKGALTCKRANPRFAYIAPTFRQGKAVAFDYLQKFSRDVPGTVVNQSELRVDYPNHGQVRIYGADNPDSLRGIYLDGAVLDEYGLMAPNVFSEVLRPALSDRVGWVLFIGTPNGHNQFYDAYKQAERDPAWFCAVYKASETGVLPATELTDARKVMTDDEYRQEFECSFEAAIKGSIYGKELEKAKVDGRITRIPYEPLLPVDTDWDLGVGDATAIWFSQTLTSGEVRLIDYIEASGEGLPYYVNLLQSKGYSYGDHWAPHDIQVREFSSGRSRYDTAKGLGIHFKVSPRIPIEDGIHAGRMLFPRCYFDEVKCAAGLEALQHYRRDYNSRLNEFKSTPIHDVFSHAADAFRGLATRPGRKKVVPLQAPSLPMAASGPLSWMDA